jgi:methionyl-tRNA synthetase
MRVNGMTLALVLAAHAPRATRAFVAHHRRRAFSSAAAARVGGPSSPSAAAAAAAAGTPPTPFDDGVSPFEITTPIYYVNDKPHIGHAYTSVACDVIARYMRHSGRDVYFLSGTDEHGQKVEATARGAGMEPREFCDDVSRTFRDLLGLLNVSNDRFIRTTEDHHEGAVRHFWRTLADAGAVYLGSYEGWYSVRDECYYNESELVDGRAPTGAEVSWVKKEDSYFFRLSEYADRLLEHYESHPHFIAPESRRNEVVSFVRGGLRDLSISRTTFDWGVRVPGDEGHVMYVWIDALANYISALGYPEETGDGSDFDRFWPASLHVVGKDILRFHAVYWPAFLMAAGLPLPRRIFAHGWWTKDGEKISKSLGNVVDPVELVSKYGVDPTRFFLMSEVTFGSDGDFSDDRMVHKVNANLSNELGNLNQRIMTLVYKNCDGATPAEIGTFTAEDEAMLATARSLRSRTGEAMSTQSIDRYVQHMISAVWDANRYIDAQAPWVLKKTDVGRMRTVLYVLMEVMRHVAILYQPLMPASSNAILDQLGVPADERDFVHLGREGCEIKLGREVIKPTAVFPRFEVPVGAAA